MPTMLQTLRQNRRKLVPLGVVLVGAVALFVGHGWARAEVVSRAADAGVQVRRADVSVSLGGSATLRNVEWSVGRLSATIESVEVDVGLLSLLGTPEVERIAVTGVKIVRGDKPAGQSSDSPSEPIDPVELVGRVLARLGGTPPEVAIERLEVTASISADKTVGLAIDQGIGRVDGDQWRFTAPARISAPSVEGLAFPAVATVQATMNLEEGEWLLESAILKFAEPATITRPDGISASVVGVGVTGQGDALLTEVEAQMASPYVVGPVKVSQIVAGPLSAIAARAPELFRYVRVSGAALSVQPPSDGGAAKGTSSRGWNDRLATKLSQVFAQADDLLANGSRLGDTKLTILDSEVRVPSLDSKFAVREANLQNLVDGPEGRVSFAWAHRGVDRGALEVTYATHRHTVDVVATNFQLEALEGLTGKHLSGAMNAKVALEQSTDTGGELSYPVHGSLEVTGLRFESATLASDPIEAAPINLEFAVNYRPGRHGEFTTAKASFRVGQSKFDVRPSVFGLESLPEALPERVEVAIDLESTPVQHLFDAMPVAILGPLKGAEFEGTVGLHGRMDLPLQNPSRLKWEFEPELADFRIVSLPNDVDVRRLMTSASFTLEDERIGHKRTIFIPAPRAPNNPLAADATDKWTASGDDSCGSYVYVPLDQISPHLPSGVLSTEDRGFLWHDGFNVHALRESLAANLEAGRMVRGGSTITMQLVKNLFLDRKKTISRKLREVFLTWLTESIVDVPKARLLEVYLNIIEYGPRILGIWHASTYFFGKHPRDLSVGEAAWFITTLSGPKIYHHQFVKREISENVWGRMRARIDMLYDNDYITELDLVEAKAHPPVFRPIANRCGPSSAAPKQPSPLSEVLASELLRLRLSGVDRAEITKRVEDPIWRSKTLAAPRAHRGPIDWDLLPLARDKIGWWARR